MGVQQCSVHRGLYYNCVLKMGDSSLLIWQKMKDSEHLMEVLLIKKIHEAAYLFWKRFLSDSK